MFENLPLLMNGFALAVSPYNIMLMMVGVFLGILVGVLPGLGAPNGVTLLMPLTFGMNPVSAIILLTSMYWGALYGGSTTSILFNIPGEPSSVATTFDGHPMAKAGRATEALTTAFISSGFGALFGVVVVTILSSWATRFALRFSPVEYFTVFMLAFGSFVAFGGGSPIKTVVSLGLGFAWASIGMDTVSGSMRLTYGFNELSRGINLLVVVIGLYGIAELCQTMQEPAGTMEPVATKLSPREVLRAALAMPRYWIALLRSACIGLWMGITPGGPTAATFMSYGVGRRFSKAGARFGTGDPEGLVSSETADQAAGSAAMLPMLALGLPSSATAAVLLGRPHDLGTDAGSGPVRRASRLCLGPDCLDVRLQRGLRDHGPDHGAALRGGPPSAVYHHRAAHCHCLPGRRMDRRIQHDRPLDGARLRRHRLLHDSAALSRSAVGAGYGLG